MRRLTTHVTNLRSDRRGNFGVMTALLAVPIIGAIGVAIDIGRGMSAKGQAQDALDAALLFAARQPKASWKTAAEDFFRANLDARDFKVETLSWKDEQAGTLAGEAELNLKTTFAAIFGIQSFPVSAASAVHAKHDKSPMTAVFTLESAKGWFWKEVKLWVHYPVDSKDTLIATYTYQPTSLFNDGTGTVTGPLGKAVSLGKDYENAYLTMEVSPDGCAPGYTPQHPEGIFNMNTKYWDNHICTSIVPPKKKQVSTWMFNSSDQSTADHLFINGKSISTAQPLSKLILCDKTVTQGWEDTRYYSEYDWKTQDIVFSVKGGSCVENPSQVSELRIVR